MSGKSGSGGGVLSAALAFFFFGGKGGGTLAAAGTALFFLGSPSLDLRDFRACEAKIIQHACNIVTAI